MCNGCRPDSRGYIKGYSAAKILPVKLGSQSKEIAICRKRYPGPRSLNPRSELERS